MSVWDKVKKGMERMVIVSVLKRVGDDVLFISIYVYVYVIMVNSIFLISVVRVLVLKKFCIIGYWFLCW